MERPLKNGDESHEIGTKLALKIVSICWAARFRTKTTRAGAAFRADFAQLVPSNGKRQIINRLHPELPGTRPLWALVLTFVYSLFVEMSSISSFFSSFFDTVHADTSAESDKAHDEPAEEEAEAEEAPAEEEEEEEEPEDVRCSPLSVLAVEYIYIR